MKNIQVPDEMYTALMELAKEFANQDNRSTAMPYIFQIQEERRIDGIDIWLGDYKTYLDEDHNEVFNTQMEFADRKESVYKHYKDMGEEDFVKDNGVLVMDEFDFDDFCEEHFISYGYKLEAAYKNFFLTAKGCEDHIKANKHHYGEEAKSHLNHAFRNPEMQLIQKFLCELVGKELHK